MARCPRCGSDEVCNPSNTVTYANGNVIPTTQWSCYECDYIGSAEDFDQTFDSTYS